MVSLKELKKAVDYKSKVNAWLDHIGEFDIEARQEVLDKCEADKSAAAYFVVKYESIKK